MKSNNNYLEQTRSPIQESIKQQNPLPENPLIAGKQKRSNSPHTTAALDSLYIPHRLEITLSQKATRAQQQQCTRVSYFNARARARALRARKEEIARNFEKSLFAGFIGSIILKLYYFQGRNDRALKHCELRSARPRNNRGSSLHTLDLISRGKIIISRHTSLCSLPPLLRGY